MHPCLAISEIAEVIVHFAGVGFGLVMEPEPTLRLQNGVALATLARTARTFHDHALNKLWNEQAGLINVIKCLPEGTWSATERGEMVRI